MAIHEEITRLTKVYSDLYGGVQSFIRSHPLGKEKFNLVFDVSVINVDFQEQFFECISHGVMGSFCGVNEGKSLLRELVGKYNFSSKQDTVNFLDTLMTHLNKDIRTNESVSIESQLRKGQSKKSLYNFIYSLRYLEPRYILKMGDRELSELSPGEKGTLLLVFYLLVDRSDAPLVIDQPEHNLDNETIYDLLVPAIKEAKQRRQIIIVTHNPNIAVVSDADQIICAYLDKANGNKVDYVSGSIENPQINKRVVDVLEGTIPAFDNRGMKYTAARLRIRLSS
jgi:predicted ATPase